ncbi:hypothetical protein BD408DRAFT_400555 [Parasitella parasitica]|nr:hypothetical protein BD408DRAFT_400555 [Parasitella parasitica]
MHIEKRDFGLADSRALAASIITDTLFESIEPWTDGHVKVERYGLLNSCYLLDSTRDKFYPMLYQRCMLSDTTWICAIFLCINWAVLVGFVIFISKKSISSKVAVAKDENRPGKAEEPKWGRYIPDPPSSIYSATTVGNRSGLLTPSSTLTKEKHNEFYSNCAYYRDSIPSLPSSSPYKEYSSDYLLKGGDYLSSKSYDYNGNSKSSSTYYYGGRSPSSSYYYKNNNERYHDNSGKRGEYYDDYEEENLEGPDRFNSLKPLRVNTAYNAPSSPTDKEPDSAATLATPLYSKFSNKSPAFDFTSDKRYNTYY